ncbi:ribonuclease-III-like-domain-containing protein, partial [Sphaerosporella brunnea]
KRFHNARPQPRAPYPIRARKYFAVNDDPKVLNEMYLKLFGKDMRLTEEAKWQAVTHKSFDHGRQPYNAKLRFLGKKLLELHASFHLLERPLKGSGLKDKEGKPQKYFSLEGAQYQSPEPFLHDDYKNLENVSSTRIEGYISTARLLPLAKEVELHKVMRWKPAQINDLDRSGQDVVAMECLYAIVGAVALQKGGKIAGEFIDERVL